uniref:Putative secreted protein n=1 Tax=Anopheles darlingi TaxID=43151 RepID=A0A2M4D1Z5_ANODA
MIRLLLTASLVDLLLQLADHVEIEELRSGTTGLLLLTTTWLCRSSRRRRRNRTFRRHFRYLRSITIARS